MHAEYERRSFSHERIGESVGNGGIGLGDRGEPERGGCADARFGGDDHQGSGRETCGHQECEQEEGRQDGGHEENGEKGGQEEGCQEGANEGSQEGSKDDRGPGEARQVRDSARIEIGRPVREGTGRFFLIRLPIGQGQTLTDTNRH